MLCRQVLVRNKIKKKSDILPECERDEESILFGSLHANI